ncbi:hypothetical protein HQO27_01570 [Rhodococcus fascians]|nr:hypothetical protein [Rhodococcus fascians]MBY4240586.1 hypothetical protein [Rhodococcus fascians]MBY4253462.1 hypothetical protein [Rhodococcus fascians]MBY4269099.1 hypothetical protein [Rhodococcus fascians]MBY4274529.1 hypothetical protein [Rhodococcus fascians]
MEGLLLRGILFFVSYVPLALIFAVQLLPDDEWDIGSTWPSIALMLAALAGVVLAFWVKNQAESIAPNSIVVNEVQDEGGNAAAYLATYIFPFVLSDTDRWQTWLAYGIYMLILCAVTVQSDLVIINPTLYLLGRRIVAVVHTERYGTAAPYQKRSLLVCSQRPSIGASVRVVGFAGGWIEV